MYTLIVTAKMNDIDPQAWLADTLSRKTDIRSCVCVASAKQNQRGENLRP